MLVPRLTDLTVSTSWVTVLVEARLRTVAEPSLFREGTMMPVPSLNVMVPPEEEAS
jgi:hypothetical protein